MPFPAPIDCKPLTGAALKHAEMVLALWAEVDAQAQPLAGIAAAGLARSGQADPVPGPRYPRNSLGRQ
jgi:hypothetical protein